MKQAEEAKLKSEAQKTAAAKAAFEATFKNPSAITTTTSSSIPDIDSDDDLPEETPIGDVDPSKCTAQGAGIAGGTAGAAAAFVVVTKDGEGRRVVKGGEVVRVRVSPGVGVGGSEQEGIVKDVGDGTYMVTYVVPKRGNYMVNVECNGSAIMGSPFPVFFSSGTSAGGLLGTAPTSTYQNLMNQTMPNMPNYAASVSGAFPGLLGMIPDLTSGGSGGVTFPGIGAALGEVCREHLSGPCTKTGCKLNHPPHYLLRTALAASNSMGTLTQVPMTSAAAAMAAAQALQAHVQSQSSKDSSDTEESLKKTVQVDNLNHVLTVDQLKQLFGFCGTIVDCTTADSKQIAYIEYSKPEGATAALALNNMDLGGRPLNVEMAKSLPPKPATSLPMMMQQFQQSLLLQQTMTAQQAANRAANMKSATELAAARAAEISRKLNVDGIGIEIQEPDQKTRSASAVPARSKSRSRSRSRSTVSYRLRRRSRSFSPPERARDYRSRSPVRSRKYSSYEYSRSYRDSRCASDRNWRRESLRSSDRRSPVSRRNRSRSTSPRERTRKPYRDSSVSPKRHGESPERGSWKSSCRNSRSPVHHGGSRSSPLNGSRKSRNRSRSRSDSADGKVTEKKDEKSEHRERRWSPSAFAKKEKICVSPKSASTSTSGPIACPPYERFMHMRYGPVGGDKMDEAGWEKHFDEMPRGEYHKMVTRVLRDRFDLVVSREEEGPWLKELDKNSTSRSQVFKFNPDLQYMWQKGYGSPDGDKLDFNAWKEYVHNMPDDDLVAMLTDLFYRYPDLHPQPHHHQPYPDEIDYEQYGKYWQQIDETEGFDVDVDPPPGCCGAILPMFNDTGPVSAKIYNMYCDCSSVAVDDYNQREGTNYTVIRVVKVCQALVSGLVCYINFEAIESNDHLQPQVFQPQVFQAQVYAPNLNKEEAEVILVRRKPGCF